MRGLIKAMLAGVILSGSAVIFAGCGEETGTKSETQVTGPGGKTTVTDQTTVKKSGENPPGLPGDAKNP
jgi:hypothetical protein